ncbi:biosynthetic peptidoglycan transglycosylase [Pseudomonas syringae]|uniref:biosynthetic peptidoglycan transglycosylase n=1 Tax=Pseudomonas syringae TaxID=317 RepID=UPI0009AF2D82|nr:biosynthetic peptidoglycan transglycosylase [Pseudomonas syringae]
MPKNAFLKIIITIFSAPFIAISRFAIFWYGSKLKIDFHKCAQIINCAPIAPDLYVKMLILAEDHRSKMHFGVDPIAVMRCCVIFITRKKTQGGSTIEQQFVRVVTNRYERTFRRKIREQILAIELSRHFKKNDIASAYLSIAFYGTGQYGLDAACNSQKSISDNNLDTALLTISKLKYPEPLAHSAPWIARINTRVKHIRSKMVVT